MNDINTNNTDTNEAVISNDVTEVGEIKKKILIIDDDENLTTVLTDKLNLAGFETDFAPDGDAGLNKAIEIKPDLILLDVIMPKMSGWETLEKLRTNPWGEHAKVIMLTSLDKPESVAHAMEQGTTYFLVKSNYSLDQVVDKVKEILE